MQQESKKNKEWWEKPGFGIMYQIEARPGWIWNRNFDKFNTSMMDKDGNLNFNGPFCKMEEWVEFSKKVGVDYHVFEAKWHDGICYFDTEYTNWKTPTDYCKIFSEESKKLKIPFMFYYSSIFDHNPQFDDIQPLRGITPSFIARHDDKKEKIAKYSMRFAKVIEKSIQTIRSDRGDYNIEFFDDVEFHDFTYNPEKYEEYLINQLRELIDTYNPSGMWMDWYWEAEEASTFLVMDLIEKEYPNLILTFNVSIQRNPRYIHYLSGEAHDVPTAWNSGNRYRSKEIPWELCGPAAYGWDVPYARKDPFEIFRIATIIMASGGKFCFGLPSQMDGEIYPEPAANVELFGNWYKSRQNLFTEAVPMGYEGNVVPGVEVDNEHIGVIGTLYEKNTLIHLINLKGMKRDITLRFSKEKWNNIEKILIEPEEKDLEHICRDNLYVINIKKKHLDEADTILRIKFKPKS
ncbi:MAG: alpha-L-fucosidase [Candidatus Thorarchaeota archaeon]